MSYTPIMVVKTSALGDVVQALECLSHFNEAFALENVGIEWVVEEAVAPLVALHPLVKMVHTISSKKWKKNITKPGTWKEIGSAISRLSHTSYSAALDLQGNVKSALVMRLLKAEKKIGFDRQSASEWPASYGLDIKLHTSHFKQVRDVYDHGFTKVYEELFQKKPVVTGFKPGDLLWHEYELSKAALELENFAIIAPGSRWINKQPDKTLILALARSLVESSSETIYLASGNLSERQLVQEVAQEINHARLKLLPSMSLVEFAYAIYKSKWLVAADSLALHLAGWLQVPSFGLFGPSSDFYYAPQAGIHDSWMGKCPYNLSFVKRCEKLRTCSTGACLRQAPQKAVLDQLDRWIKILNHHRA